MQMTWTIRLLQAVHVRLPISAQLECVSGCKCWQHGGQRGNSSTEEVLASYTARVCPKHVQASQGRS